MIIDGDYTVTDDNLEEARAITEVRGSLEIKAQGASLPALESVGDGLGIHAQGASLPALKSVKCELYIHAQGASLPALKSVKCELYIHAQGASLPALKSVGGWLYIHAQGASLPSLESVGRWLDIHAQGVSLPALKSVGGMPWEQPTPDEARERLEAVARAALAHDDALDMDTWHSSCVAQYCMSVWSIDQAGKHGRELERAMGSCGAGLALLGLDMAPHFFTDNETARRFLQEVLGGEN